MDTLVKPLAFTQRLLGSGAGLPEWWGKGRRKLELTLFSFALGTNACFALVFLRTLAPFQTSC
jgi:hypothetical protein